MKISSSEIKDLKRTATGGGVIAINNGVAIVEGTSSTSYSTVSKDINVKAGDVLKFRMLARKVDGAGAFNMAFSYPILSTAVNQIEITETDFRWYELSFVVPFKHNSETQYVHANAGFWTGRIGKAEIAVFEVDIDSHSTPSPRLWKGGEIIISAGATSISLNERVVNIGLQNTDIIFTDPEARFFNIDVGKLPPSTFGANPLIFASPIGGYGLYSIRVVGYSTTTGYIRVELYSFSQETNASTPVQLSSLTGEYRFNFMMVI